MNRRASLFSSFKPISRTLGTLVLSGVLVASCSTMGSKDDSLYLDPQCVVQEGEGPHLPRIDQISPREGVAAGGTLITLEGEGFEQGLSIGIGNGSCVGTSVLSSKKITCFTTANEVGQADVLVRLRDNRCAQKDSGFHFFPSVTISPRAVNLTLGGTTKFSASQGKKPYTFSIASGVGSIDKDSGLYTAGETPGVAMIRVIDESGSTGEAIVRVNPALQIHPAQVDVRSDHEFHFSAVGGVPPYNYDVSEGNGDVGPTGLYHASVEGGQAKVTLSDSLGNQSTAEVTIEPPIPPIELSAPYTTLAVNNSVEIKVTGGRPPLEWQVWSGLGSVGADGLFTASDQPGTAVVRVTDDDRLYKTISFTINPSLVIVPLSKNIFVGDSIAFAAAGGVPSYEFSLGTPDYGVLNSKTGFYTASDKAGQQTVIVKDIRGNQAEAQVTVRAYSMASNRITLGYSHSCALNNGKALCWGNNQYGQIGDGSFTTSLKPANVAGLDTGVAAIAGGQYHTCALVKGGVKCWGDNSYGQLGVNTTLKSNVPVPVIGMDKGVSSITAGTFHTCAVKHGGVFCWGDNRRGQLGNGTRIQSLVPTAVRGLGRGAEMVSAGSAHSCALVEGGVKCWGYNSSGQLGDGTLTTSLAPVQVDGLKESVQAIDSGGFHSCALSGGTPKCWGHNGAGQLGDGTSINRYWPVEVKKLKGDVLGFKAGYYHTCALVSGGEVQCWGYNHNGQIGPYQSETLLSPVSISGLSPSVEAVASGVSHTCALEPEGIRCWGENSFGQFGNRTRISNKSPVPLVPLTSDVPEGELKTGTVNL